MTAILTGGKTPALPSVALLVTLQAVVSAASLVVEIVAGRMLAPYVGMSLYTWTSIIAVVLAGFSAGHWAGGRIAEMQTPRALLWTGWSMLGAGVTTALAVFVLRSGADILLPHIANPIGAIVALCMIAFFLPSFFAGIPAPVLAQISVAAAPDHSGRALGAMFASGAIGAILGTLLAGFVFVAWLGSVGTLALVTLCYLLSALLLLWLARRAGDPSGMLMAGLAMLVGLLLAGATVAQPSPCTEESDYFCIRVEDVSANPESPVRMMVLDHLVHGVSARDLPDVIFYDHAALLDLLARERMGGSDFSAFFIGGGTFTVPRKWSTLDPQPDVTVAEIDPTVTEVAIRDFWFDATDTRILNQDARAALRTDGSRYDVIIGDAFTDIAVPAHLVTQEFFELVRDHLTEDGVYLMNVIDHADRMIALMSLVHTLEQVFPHVEIWTEARRPEPGERMINIIAAGFGPTDKDLLQGLSPAPITFGRIPPKAVAQLKALRKPIVLTDDYAPIDRLIGAESY
ncbi:fused MFS/spermidine synthase [Seohaeicola saemankumensis]|uniref:Fused MFS/spermidine synthase n=1 Tax=Seohaeicola saemankumensis TaxID=481181 RepID=A0ABW3THA7_9RHOB